MVNLYKRIFCRGLIYQTRKEHLSFPHVLRGLPAAQSVLWQAGNPEKWMPPTISIDIINRDGHVNFILLGAVPAMCNISNNT
jgi:hypothetical protein